MKWWIIRKTWRKGDILLYRFSQITVNGYTFLSVQHAQDKPSSSDTLELLYSQASKKSDGNFNEEHEKIHYTPLDKSKVLFAEIYMKKYIWRNA